MTPRQRICNVLERKPTDRVPVDLWLTPEMLTALRDACHEQDDLTLYNKLGVDKLVNVFPTYARRSTDPNEQEGRDLWGVPMVTIEAGAATYHEYGQAPLGAMQEAGELADYAYWPDPDAFNVRSAHERARQARAAGFATVGPWISHFEIYCHMRGMENALMDVVANAGFLEAALDQIDAIQTAMLKAFLTQLGDDLDLVFISDDMGSQESMLFSLEHWNRFLRPRLERWCRLIHEHDRKVIFHTDGAVRDLLPGLIASGVDVLNPIQHVCPGMERSALKRDFGEDLIFYGGVENQDVLPHGTPAQVREEVLACLQTLGAGGGYIACSCHNVQPGTPVENVLALVETVHAWRG